jgi:hypothetical protein
MDVAVQHTLATAAGASCTSWQTAGRKQRQMEVTLLEFTNTTLNTICAAKLRKLSAGCLL